MGLLDLFRYVGALAMVLALVGLAGLGARRFGVPGVLKGQATRRLQVIETLMIGPRQRVFIIRRDYVEHLVLSSPEGASVLEAGIPARREAPAGQLSTVQA
jgi:flagellar protein FliO/FliZ